MGVVDFHVLGTVEVCLDAQPVDLGRAGTAKVRCLLAALLASPGSVVPAGLLVQRVWGHQQPSSSLRYKYVAWLRSALTPVGVALESQHGSYVLRVKPESVDVYRFQRLVGKSRAAADNQRAADAADAARGALTLWRGPALSGLSGTWAQNYRDQLDRQRRDAVATWANAALVLKEHQSVVDELSRWHTEYPADETIAATLMLALHQVGRTGDALACFQATQQYIRAELGVAPGPDVTGLYHRIRSGQSVLAPNAGSPSIGPPLRIRDQSVLAQRRAAESRVRIQDMRPRPAECPADAGSWPGAPVRSRYHQQVRRIAPAQLLDRDPELAELAHFCTSPASAGQYLWWRARAWSGKSALLSWFVLHPPAGVRIVSFFITARLAGQSTRTAFVDNLLEQLLALVGQQPPALLTDATRDAHVLGLLAEAAEACCDCGDRFALVVDGLDEDRSVQAGTDWHSIAALLPMLPPAGMRVIVSGRTDPPLPGDVPAAHPLRDPAVVRLLDTSPHATAIRHEIHRDLAALLRGGVLGQDLLGLVTAAGGGLTAADLAELTGCAQWQVTEHLHSVAGRTFTRRDGYHTQGATSSVYLLAHEELQVTAENRLGQARLAGYRQRLHEWAEQYRARQWPPDTPEYLLLGYHNMLLAAGDLPRLIRCATDPARQDRMLSLLHGDSTALAEITTALDLCAAQQPPALAAMVRLAQHRDRLQDRNRRIPDTLAMAWARLGRVPRAEALARSNPDPLGQISVLNMVAGIAAEMGDHERAEQIWHENEATARSIVDPARQLEALTMMAEAMAKTGSHERVRSLLRDAETTARSIVNARYPGLELTRVVTAAANVQEHEYALAIARTIPTPGEQARAVECVAVAIARAGDHHRAETIVQSIPDRDGQQARASGAVALTVAASTAIAAATVGDCDQAEAIARSITFPPWHRSAVPMVLEAMATAGHHARALTNAHAITNPVDQSHAVRTIVEALARSGDHERAAAIANSIADPFEHAKALEAVVEAITRTGDYPHAQAIARCITDPDRQAYALGAIAHAMAAHGEHESAQQLLHHVEAVVRALTDPQHQQRALDRVAVAVAQAGDHEQAAAIARFITSDQTLAGVVEAMANAGDHQPAVVMAHTITDPRHRDWALTEVARAVAKAGNQDYAAAIAGSLTNPDQREHALRVAAAAHTNDQGSIEDLPRDTETIIRATADPIQWARVLRSLARAMASTRDHDHANTVLHAIEAFARSLADPYTQAGVLQSIAALAEPTQRAQIVAALLKVTRWYETAYDLLAIAPDVIKEPISELVAAASSAQQHVPERPGSPGR